MSQAKILISCDIDLSNNRSGRVSTIGCHISSLIGMIKTIKFGCAPSDHHTTSANGICEYQNAQRAGHEIMRVSKGTQCHYN